MCKLISNLSYTDHYSKDVCLERKNRQRLALAAYAYEFKSDNIMTDDEFDELAKKIRPQMKTGNERIDKFFREEYSPDTGQWIHKHPDLDKVAAIYYIYSNPNQKLIRFGAKIYGY